MAAASVSGLGGKLEVVLVVLVCDGGRVHGGKACEWNHADPVGKTGRTDHELTGILAISIFLI